MNEITVKKFNYENLKPATLEFLRFKEECITNRTKRTVIENGRDLIEIKERLGHGCFTPWLDSFFGGSVRTARNWMRIYIDNKEIAKTATVAVLDNFDIRALIEFSKNDTPPEAKEEALALAADGEKINQAVALKLKEKNRKLQFEKDQSEQEKIRIEKDRDELKEHHRKAIDVISDKENEIFNLREKIDRLAVLIDEDFDDKSVDVIEYALMEFETLKNHLNDQKQNVQFYQDKIKEYEESGTGKEIIKKVIEEKEIQVVPGDYMDLKARVANYMNELDELSKKNKQQYEKYEKLKSQSKFSRSIGIIENSIRLIYDAAAEIPKDQILDITFLQQSMISAAVEKLIQITPLANDLNITNKSSLRKLIKAGFTPYRPDEENKKILIFNSDRNSWVTQVKFETKKKMREALKEIMENEKNIIC